MAITVPGQASHAVAGVTTNSITITGVSAGEKLVLAVGNLGSALVSTVVMSSGTGTWAIVPGGSHNNGGSLDIEFWECDNPSTGSCTVLITYTNSATNSQASVLRLAGAGGLDVTGFSNNTGASTIVTCPSLTPSVSGDIHIVYAVGAGTITGPVANGGVTFNAFGASGTAADMGGYFISTDALAKQSLFSDAATNVSLAVGITYSPPVAPVALSNGRVVGQAVNRSYNYMKRASSRLLVPPFPRLAI
jgi:hypothetical protein